MRAALIHLALLAIGFAGCSGFKQSNRDTGADSNAIRDGAAMDIDLALNIDGPKKDSPAAADAKRDSVLPDGPISDSVTIDVGPTPDFTFKPNAPCRTLTLPCLASSPVKVIDVPGEMTAANAFKNAKAGDTIQINGKTLGAGWWIPPYVTLRGCNGAQITGSVGFSGSAGTVEGFAVGGKGQIVANRTGSYTVRHNVFSGVGTDTAAGVSGRSIDGLVSAAVDLRVESNRFSGRRLGVEARTKYDVGVHEVRLTVQNNIFDGVQRPIELSEGGLVGKVVAAIDFNTLYKFDTGLSLIGVDRKTVTRANVFAEGRIGIQASSVYEAHHSFVWKVSTTHSSPPLVGALSQGDPAFVNAAGGDFRLSSTSALIDRVPKSAQVPTEDYYGCARPVAIKGTQALADVGALEAQP